MLKSSVMKIKLIFVWSVLQIGQICYKVLWKILFLRFIYPVLFNIANFTFHLYFPIHMTVYSGFAKTFKLSCIILKTLEHKLK